MRFRAIVIMVTFALSLLAAPPPAEAEKAEKVYRIGVLGHDPPGRWNIHIFEALRQGLRDFGYEEGENIFVEHRFSYGKAERSRDHAAEHVRLQVDVIVAVTTTATRAAMNATNTTPIVMLAGDPVRQGLVASLARPGGNVTGLATFIPELCGKQLELLKEAVPHLSRVAVLWHSTSPDKSMDCWRETQAAARALGVTLQSVEVRGPDDFERAFAAVTMDRPDALFTFASPVTFWHRKEIVDFAAKNGVPAMYGLGAFADAGGLMAYAPNLPAAFRRIGYFVDKILKGANPAEMPVERPTKFDLIINLKTAKALGLTIPPSVLVRADKVIE